MTEVDVINVRSDELGGVHAKGTEDRARVDECSRVIELIGAGADFPSAVRRERDRLLSLSNSQLAHAQVGVRLHELIILEDRVSQ